jgi:MscS family membrane protein
MTRAGLFLLALISAGILLWSGAGAAADEKSKAAKEEEAAAEESPSVLGDKAVDAAVDHVEAALLGAADSGPAPIAWAAKWFLPFLRAEIFGFSVASLLTSFLILLLSLIFRNILSHLVLERIVKFSHGSSYLDARVVTALTKPLSAFLLLFGIYLALMVLPLDAGLDGLVTNLFRGASMLAVVWGALMLSDVFADQLERRMAGQPQSLMSGFAPLIKKSLKIFVLVVGVLMTIDNLGYNVTGILATLGLGTAAIALASQDTIKNAFGAMMIALDRPFQVGDWIQVGDKVDGDVESIGLRSTKVRTWPKTILSIPNGVLANEYINNWSRMPKRRVKQIVGITYEATAADMEALVEDIRRILREDEGVQQDFILVNFTDFGDSSLDILVYYFTKTTAWLEHMDIRQRVNCKIMEAIRTRGLSIAFPTRSLYLDGPAASKMAGIPYQSRWDDNLPGGFGADTPP